MYPMAHNGTIDMASAIGPNTYKTNNGKSMIHLVNGQAGNIEAHSVLNKGQNPANLTAYLDQVSYGYTKLTVWNASTIEWQFIKGSDGSVGDYLYVHKG